MRSRVREEKCARGREKEIVYVSVCHREKEKRRSNKGDMEKKKETQKVIHYLATFIFRLGFRAKPILIAMADCVPAREG